MRPSPGSPERGREEERERQRDRERPLERQRAAECQCRREITVLVVDDQGLARRGLVALLATCAGIRVIGEANDGAEAIRLVESHHPDVVLMDARMPVMDGIEATRHIKGRWPKTGVLVHTMFAALAREVRTAGADAFLPKGCPACELEATIRGIAALAAATPGTAPDTAAGRNGWGSQPRKTR